MTLTAEVTSAAERLAAADTRFLDLSRKVAADLTLMPDLGQARRELDDARAALAAAEAALAAAPPEPEEPSPTTVGDAMIALANAKAFRPADLGFGHATAARVRYGVTLDPSNATKAYRLLADYRDTLAGLGIDYDTLPRPASPVGAPDPVAPRVTTPVGRSRVWVEGATLWLKSPFAAKDIVADRITAAVWQRARLAYKLPATPAAALAVAEALGQYGIDADDAATALVRTGRAGQGAQIKRVATDLPPVPGSKTDAWTHQRQAFWFARELPGAILDMAMGTGKAQPLSARVLTPDGWTTMGALAPGDAVIGSDGAATKVVAVHERGVRAAVRVTLSDGRSTVCCPDHLWAVQTASGRSKGAPARVLPTSDLIAAGVRTPQGNRRWFIPALPPVRFAPAPPLPVDPYVLGVLLGDGGLTGGAVTFTKPDAHVVDRVRAAAESAGLTVSTYREGLMYGLVTDRGQPNPLLDQLRTWGLMVGSHERFIPDVYLTATPADRLALLQGLCDTDGSPGGRAVDYHSSSERLARGLVDLARSLGGTATIRGRSTGYKNAAGDHVACRDGWRVRLVMPADLPPFSLPRKADRLHVPQHAVGVAIESIEHCGTEVMRCITVEAEDGLYVTDDYVVTHNSKVVCDLIHDSGAESVMIVCPERVVGVWPKQFGIHSGGEKHIIDPRRQNRRGEWELLPIAKRVELYDHALHECTCGLPHVLMTNYSAAAHEPFKSWSLRQRFDYVAYDEAHRLRSPNGVWSKWAKQMHSRTERAIGGTGTFQAQTPLDVFGQVRAVEPGLFGHSYVAFEKRYAVKGGFEGKQVVGYQREDELAERLSSICYRAGEEVLDLPEMLDDVRVVGNLSPRAWKAYREIEQEMYAVVARHLEDGSTVDDEITVDNVLVRILRCQQVTGGALPLDSGLVEEIDTTKFTLLCEELEDIPASEPVVVFARFHHDLDKIEAAARKMGRSYGELSGRRSDALASDATLAEGVQVAGVQLQSGGTGVDFTRSAYGIYYSVGHSLADYLQSRKRLQRPGQTRRVRFRHLVLDGTVDVDVYDALAERQSVTDRIALKVRGIQSRGATF